MEHDPDFTPEPFTLEQFEAFLFPEGKRERRPDALPPLHVIRSVNPVGYGVVLDIDHQEGEASTAIWFDTPQEAWECAQKIRAKQRMGKDSHNAA